MLLELIENDTELDKIKDALSPEQFNALKANLQDNLDAVLPFSTAHFYVLGLYTLKSDGLIKYIKNGSLQKLLSLLNTRYKDDPRSSAFINQFETDIAKFEKEITPQQPQVVEQQSISQQLKGSLVQSFKRPVKETGRPVAADTTQPLKDKLPQPLEQEYHQMDFTPPEKYFKFLEKGVSSSTEFTKVSQEKLASKKTPKNVEMALSPGVISNGSISRIQRLARWGLLYKEMAKIDPRYEEPGQRFGQYALNVNEAIRLIESIPLAPSEAFKKAKEPNVSLLESAQQSDTVTKPVLDSITHLADASAFLSLKTNLDEKVRAEKLKSFVDQLKNLQNIYAKIKDEDMQNMPNFIYNGEPVNIKQFIQSTIQNAQSEFQKLVNGDDAFDRRFNKQITDAFNKFKF